MQNARTISGLDLALAVWRRRKWLMLLLFVVPLAATVPVVRSLPNVYESTATLLVEHQQVSADFGGTSAAQDWLANNARETWLRTIIQQILSRSRLSELIARLNLYPEMRGRTAPEAAAERMRGSIRFQFELLRQQAGTGPDATIAFSLSYRGRDPETVARVTNALAALYVEENARTRERQTIGATAFLRAQLEDVKKRLYQQDAQISEFKNRHTGELPELQAVNLAALERLNGQLRTIMDRRSEVTRRLAEFPVAGDTPTTRLNKLRQDLADLRTRYTDEHPNVVRVKQKIADLERQLSAGGGAAAEGAPALQLTDRPGTAVEGELAGLRSEEQAIRREIGTYQGRIEDAPLMQQELQRLTQDYAATEGLYQSLQRRYEDALLTERMAQQSPQGEQFRILDPAVVPRQPMGPHRFRLLSGVLMASAAVAVGAAFLAEVWDTSFHTVDDVRAFTSVPVLTSIPAIVTETDARRRRRRFGLAALAAVLGVAAIVGVSSHIAHTGGPLASLLAGGHL